MYQAIIFDIGGVVLDLHKRPTLKGPEAMQALFDLSFDEAKRLWDKNKENLILGKETPIQFLSRVREAVGTFESEDSLLAKWEQISIKDESLVDQNIVALIEGLKKGYNVYALTDAFNVGQDSETMLKIRNYFDYYYVSYEHGFRKPHVEVYTDLLRIIQKQPTDCVFVDDTRANISGAELVGIVGVNYSGYSQLLKDLQELGVIKMPVTR